MPKLTTTILAFYFLFFAISANAQVFSKEKFEELNLIISDFVEQGYYEEALPPAEKAVAMTLATKDENYAIAIYNLGIILFQMGDYEQAESYYQEALVLEEKIHGKESKEAANLLNDLAVLYETIGQYKKSEALYKRVLKIDQKTLGAEHPDVAMTLNNLAYLYSSTSRYKEAEQLYKEAIQIQEKAYAGKGEELALTIGNLGLLLQNWGLYDEAEELLLQALKLEKEALGEVHPAVGQTLGNIGNLYQTTAKNNLARTFYLESLHIIDKMSVGNELEKARVLNNLAVLDADDQDYATAEKNFKETIFLQKQGMGEVHPNIAISMGHLAEIYQHQEKFDEAEKLFLQAYDMQRSIFGDYHAFVGTALSSLGNYYDIIKEVDKAELYLTKTIETQKKVFGIGHPELARAQSRYASFCNNRGDSYKALSILKQAILSCATSPVDTTHLVLEIQNLVIENQFNNFEVTAAVLDNFASTSKSLYDQTKDVEQLKNAFQYLLSLAAYLQRTNMDLSNVNDKLNQLKLANDCAKDGINIAQQLYKLTKDKLYLKACFVFSEYNKSAILSSALQGTRALNFGDVPDSLVAKERDLKEQLDLLKKELATASKANDSLTVTALSSVLISSTMEQKSFLKNLEKNYPEYSKLKYQNKMINSQEIQEKLLDKSTALIEYFVHESAVYIIVLTQKDIQLYSSEIDLALIKQLRNSLTNFAYIVSNEKKAFILFADAAHSLYKQLIQPAEKQLEGIQKLILVPDNVLGHIPFEVLLSQQAEQAKIDYKSLKYLINKYTISYNYSANLLLENKPKKVQQGNGMLLAFGASYEENDKKNWEKRSVMLQELRKSLQPLPAALKEVETLQKTFSNGTFFLKEQATEANFKAHSGDYTIIHLAMHGLLNHSYPLLSSLAFTEEGDSLNDNFLEAHEISNLHLNAELVVLSACETGYGKFEQGEGVISLARSFMYAGVPSLVVSLWQVNDQSTSLVMNYFYQNISNGQAKDEALRNAKLTYMENTSGIAQHPAFWSPFIQLGDTSPVSLSRGVAWGWWLLGLVVLLGGIFVVMKKKR